MRAVCGCCCMLFAVAVYGYPFRLRFSDRDQRGGLLPAAVCPHCCPCWVAARCCCRCPGRAMRYPCCGSCRRVDAWTVASLPTLPAASDAAARRGRCDQDRRQISLSFLLPIALFSLYPLCILHKKTVALCCHAPLWRLYVPCNPCIIRLCRRKLSSK